MAAGNARSDAYDHVHRHAQIDDVLLTKADIEAHDAARALVADHRPKLRFLIERREPLVDLDLETGIATGRFSMCVTIDAPKALVEDPQAVSTPSATDDAVDKTRILIIEAEHKAIFSNIPHDAEPDAVGLFIGLVGKFAVYPYFRNLVSQAAGMTHLDLPILPVLRDPQDRPDRPHQPAPAADTTTAPTKPRKRRKPAEAANKD
ncbi:hypothetical protein P7L78_26930 [Tistrella bauzanensis]|uniref:Preprotein translocase subunit SecB n=1 Tax=Tistrella arctica TaxID=3133430 RepID=A0ABU9YGX1_9PROT